MADAREGEQQLAAACACTHPRPTKFGLQVLPVVTRLCAPIEGTDAAHLADCLGLDSSRYRSAPSSTAEAADASLLGCQPYLDSDSLYQASPVPLLPNGIKQARCSRRTCGCAKQRMQPYGEPLNRPVAKLQPALHFPRVCRLRLQHVA